MVALNTTVEELFDAGYSRCGMCGTYYLPSWKECPACQLRNLSKMLKELI